jgi:hypothetical protein
VKRRWPSESALGKRAVALQLLGEILWDLHVGRAGIDDEVRRRTAVDGGRQNEHAAHSLELLRRPARVLRP